MHRTHASANAILAQTHEWSAQGKLKMQQFELELQYFRSRYFENGDPIRHFAGLNLRNNDRPELVRAALAGNINDPADCIAALLIVIYRLRNNLFMELNGHMVSRVNSKTLHMLMLRS